MNAPGSASRPSPTNEAIPLDRLAMLADALIPSAAELPGAGSLDFEAAFAARPDLHEPALRGLQLLGESLAAPPGAQSDTSALPRDDPASAHAAALAAFKRLQTLDVEAHAALSMLIAAVYYADERVCNSIGYPGPGVPQRPDSVADDIELEPLIARVIARGECFRDAKATGAA